MVCLPTVVRRIDFLTWRTPLPLARIALDVEQLCMAKAHRCAAKALCIAPRTHRLLGGCVDALFFSLGARGRRDLQRAVQRHQRPDGTPLFTVSQEAVSYTHLTQPTTLRVSLLWGAPSCIQAIEFTTKQEISHHTHILLA